ncbi:exodeoxyribonuclease VII small subunit [Govanella unica]|uniref:Exodeoxyribonuclease 7 small subunit n=1 Tax=Govanella unica TaxID=2975056 RepID=A0A9X3Z7G2_9PROT|nr:exodeoxyribonuclease VII small subunit [Govania unica]MDA5194028.1 exodeoxyribonuclease VII small subunit [Govania unica]
MELPDDIRNMSFEEALAALEGIVQKLEKGQVPLEESIEIYTRGTYLRQHCDAKLKDAEARIRKITVSSTGELGAEPLDVGQ